MSNQDLEFEANKLLSSGNEINFSPALYSIAISLKRIADVICAPPPIFVAPKDGSIEEGMLLQSGGFISFVNEPKRYIVMTAEEYEKYKNAIEKKTYYRID